MKTKSLNNLISLARQEQSPAVNVADEVIRVIGRAGARTADVCRTYMWMGIVSAAAAACIAVAATLAWQNQTDSVGEMLTYIAWVEL